MNDRTLRTIGIIFVGVGLAVIAYGMYVYGVGAIFGYSENTTIYYILGGIVALAGVVVLLFFKEKNE